MNLYGDRGNVLTLQRRCAWRDIRLVVTSLGIGDEMPVLEPDLIFMGGDQDREQVTVAQDLQRHRDSIKKAVDRGTPLLAVCGGYQLLQRFYRPATGADLEGLGIFDAYTIHPGPGAIRCVGNIVVEWEGQTVVGFENHGGRTYLEGDTEPLATVVVGQGNNGKDKTEGARVGNAFGTYIHGSLLPKNPSLADRLLKLAMQRKQPGFEPAPLDDSLELRAHQSAVRQARA